MACNDKFYYPSVSETTSKYPGVLTFSSPVELPFLLGLIATLGLAIPAPILFSASNVICSLVCCPCPGVVGDTTECGRNHSFGVDGGPVQLFLCVIVGGGPALWWRSKGEGCGLLCGVNVGSANSSTTWLPVRDSYVFCLGICGTEPDVCARMRRGGANADEVGALEW